jgi:hypothetical protein
LLSESFKFAPSLTALKRFVGVCYLQDKKGAIIATFEILETKRFTSPIRATALKGSGQNLNVTPFSETMSFFHLFLFVF